MLIKNFDNGYGLPIRIDIVNGECDICGKKSVPVITMDCTDGKYKSGYICKNCVEEWSYRLFYSAAENRPI